MDTIPRKNTPRRKTINDKVSYKISVVHWTLARYHIIKRKHPHMHRDPHKIARSSAMVSISLSHWHWSKLRKNNIKCLLLFKISFCSFFFFLLPHLSATIFFPKRGAVSLSSSSASAKFIILLLHHFSNNIITTSFLLLIFFLLFFNYLFYVYMLLLLYLLLVLKKIFILSSQTTRDKVNLSYITNYIFLVSYARVCNFNCYLYQNDRELCYFLNHVNLLLIFA